MKRILVAVAVLGLVACANHREAQRDDRELGGMGGAGDEGVQRWEEEIQTQDDLDTGDPMMEEGAGTGGAGMEGEPGSEVDTGAAPDAGMGGAGTGGMDDGEQTGPSGARDAPLREGETTVGGERLEPQSGTGGAGEAQPEQSREEEPRRKPLRK